MNDNEIMYRLDRIERLLKQLVKEAKENKKAPLWVRANIIAEMTGWNNNRMRTMRIHGIVKVRQVGKRFEYDADSIPAIFIRQQPPTPQTD